MGLHGQAGPWLLLSHPRFQAVNNLLGLTNVEIRFLEGSSKATSHFSEFFFVQFTLVLEQPQ